MFAYTLLLYETDPYTARHFKAVAAELGMAVIEAMTPDMVQQAMSHKFFELALVNINLPPVELHPETKRIVYGTADRQSLPAILRLRPDGIITSPFKPAATHHVLTRVSGLIPVMRTLPCLFVELETLLRERIFRLQALMEQPEYHLPFSVFPLRFCGWHCSFAIPSQEMTAENQHKYQTLGVSTSRGHMVCAFRDNCRLFRLAEQIEAQQAPCGLPAATWLTEKHAVSGSNDELTARIKRTTATYHSCSSDLRTIRQEICRHSCYTPDEKGVSGSTIKKTCCEFGCVLDNYFNLSPDKEWLRRSKALVYDTDSPETRALLFLCKDFGMDPLYSPHQEEAQQILSTNKIPFAFINPRMDPVSVPNHTRVIVMDVLSLGMIARIMTYRPVGIIPKPFDLATLSLAFAKALNIPLTQESFLSLLTNLEMELDGSFMALNTWLFDTTHKYSLPDSIKFFCENLCPHAVTQSALEGKDTSRYFLLNNFTRKGAIYCREKPTCKLWKLLTETLAPAGETIQQSPVDFLRQPADTGSGMSLMQQMTLTCDQAGHRSEEINKLRHYFCTHVCDKKQSDFQIKKGDFLFSSLNEILARNNFVYCREHDCAVMEFFTCFRKTMA